ncbi:MAG: hypothetical protein AB7S38_01695 [Vulcanimicrobiota bacterium]
MRCPSCQSLLSDQARRCECGHEFRHQRDYTRLQVPVLLATLALWTTGAYLAVRDIPEVSLWWPTLITMFVVYKLTSLRGSAFYDSPRAPWMPISILTGTLLVTGLVSPPGQVEFPRWTYVVNGLRTGMMRTSVERTWGPPVSEEEGLCEYRRGDEWVKVRYRNDTVDGLAGSQLLKPSGVVVLRLGEPKARIDILFPNEPGQTVHDTTLGTLSLDTHRRKITSIVLEGRGPPLTL